MLRDTGLHAGLAMGISAVLGAILDHVAIGMAVGLVAAALVTWRWPVSDADHDANHAVRADR